MKNYIKTTVIFGAFTLLANMSLAYLYTGSSNQTQGNQPHVASNGGAKSAGCTPATETFLLDFNDVSALLEMGGVMFYDRAKNVSGYEVPKGGNAKAIYAAALWMGGTDVNGRLKLAAVRFRSGNEGDDFWGGPLTVFPGTGPGYDPTIPAGDNTIRPYGDANISAEQCAKYDKFYPMDKAVVIRFSIWWEACVDGNAEPGACDLIEEESIPTNEELAVIYEWPAHGDLSLGQDYYLAPYYDRNKDNVYNPVDDGDYPWFDDILGRDDVECGFDRRVTLFGDRTIWFVFNDKGNVHTGSKGEPIGMEIRAQAFAFATSDEINRMTFYNYELINRSTQTLENTFFSQYVDCEVGYAGDDYVGCDVSRGLGYAYNGDPFDETNGSQIGYQANPPAIGIDFFEGPYQDADGIDNPGPRFDPVTQTWYVPNVSDAIDSNGIVYSGIGTGYGDGIIDNERFGMRRFTYFTNGASYPYSDPDVANQYYNFMAGKWGDGSAITYGGNAQSSAGMATDYVFPGDSDPLHWGTGGVAPSMTDPWTEAQAGNPPGDRRFVQSAGPFILVPGAMNNITVGIVYGRAAGGDLMASVEVMKIADTKAQALFDACFKILDPPNAPKVVIQELENELIFTLSNPATSNNYREAYEEVDDINIPVNAVDRTYNFEGYQIFQMVDETASTADLFDKSKARIVAQSDLKNGITTLINYEVNEQYGYLEAKVRTEVAADNGIQHSYRITRDAFALGTNSTLVNHKTYYYITVAYGHNEYEKYDPNDPTKLQGQKTPYVSSRLSYDGTAVKNLAAVPHNPKPELGGTSQYVNYGTTPRITRLDGHGNGNNAVEITAESRNAILNNGTLDKVKYDFGGGPIKVKVVDPLNVTGGYYELKFRDYNVNTGSSGTNSADTASWTVYRYSSEGGSLVDSVRSETLISINNEQIIADWGISIQITQNKYITGISHAASNYTEPISASIHFADSSKRWLGGVQDDDLYRPTNWIRAGRMDPGSADPNVYPWLDPSKYGDELGVDDQQLYERLLNGTIAPHRVTGYNVEFMPMAYSPNVTNVVYARGLASISYLPSVDIVITSDTSKWTRVPVIEMGRDNLLTIGNAKAGELRKSPSVNKRGLPDGDGDGLGWFPGYAIDLETGTRLHMAIGENSYLLQDGGKDMIWNPSSRMFDNNGNYVVGGVQPFWVFGNNMRKINALTNHLKDLRPYNPNDLSDNHVIQLLRAIEANVGPQGENAQTLYGNLMWIANPLTLPGKQLLATDVTIKLRVNKEYKNYVATGLNNGRPMYSWNMDEIATSTGNRQVLAEVLDMINIVPNPYLAYSEYEKSRLDTRIKIVNLPDVCTVKIFTSSGKLVRTFKKDSPVTSIDWDLNNHARIPVASGMYLVHVDVPEVGERVLKAFIGVRQVDLQGI